MAGERSVQIGGNVVGSSIVTGDGNRVATSYTKVTLPPASAVDIAGEVAAIRAILGGLGGADAGKIGRALADAEDEAARPEPDRDEIGGALERALKYAKDASGFAEHVEKLVPHVRNAVGWLGENWHRLLPVVGLMV
ncbi:hypothetical protein [Marinimicrococcus flavescens]|uniref:Uncharacterized protein n=1 Tax=Marinimicrococcus flavescens TaxID=3031815 RepID=A0AAP4D5Z7_9PROT|nr:hypothetical protein [Marinimicrococcus flavescens]